jgi:hypothetical protein
VWTDAEIAGQAVVSVKWRGQGRSNGAVAPLAPSAHTAHYWKAGEGAAPGWGIISTPLRSARPRPDHDRQAKRAYALAVNDVRRRCRLRLVLQADPEEVLHPRRQVGRIGDIAAEHGGWRAIRPPPPSPIAAAPIRWRRSPVTAHQALPLEAGRCARPGVGIGFFAGGNSVMPSQICHRPGGTSLLAKVFRTTNSVVSLTYTARGRL